VLGVVAKPHGLRGELTVHVFNADSQILEVGRSIWLAPPHAAPCWRQITAVSGTLLRLEGIDTREAAAAVRGAELIVDRAELPAPEEEEVYLHDLLGFRVFDANGNEIGTFRGVQVNGSREYFVVDGEREVLLPVEAPVIGSVDAVAKTMKLTVEVDEGE
jgi:16S rRNA processing protein RimM